MTNDVNEKGSSVSHNKIVENTKENGIRMKGMSQEEFDGEITEMKDQVSTMIILL